MSAYIDLNDVPHVAPQDLMRIMQTLIATENGLLLLKGLNKDTHAALEDAIWTAFADEPQRRLAILVRFECLVELFSSRRFKDQFTLHGLSLLVPAFAVAATQRLNTNWGFNPQKFLMGLLDQLKIKAIDTQTPRIEPFQQRAVQHTERQLAA